MKSGRLEIILGPMFSGKSTEIIEIYNRYETIGKNILTLSYHKDTRYGNGVISSHNMVQKKCEMLENLMDIYDTQKYNDSEIIFIEEAQFFGDLRKFVEKATDLDKKHVVVAGLSGDYKREKFGQILDIIPLAESIEKLDAFCIICKDGTLASFTKRIVNDTKEQEKIGGKETYIPVCRTHYLN